MHLVFELEVVWVGDLAWGKERVVGDFQSGRCAVECRAVMDARLRSPQSRRFLTVALGRPGKDFTSFFDADPDNIVLNGRR